jgi:hypothetical protein
MEFGLDLGGGPGPGRPERARNGSGRGPKRLLVVGDFAGRSPRPALASRPTHAVDLDRLDAVLARLAPSLTLDDGSTLGFAELDDFHPDALWARLPRFEALRDARARGPTAQAAAPAGAPAAAPATGGDLLGNLLGGRPAGMPATPAPAAATGTAQAAVEALVRRAMAGQAVPDRRAEIAAWNRAVDLAASEQMRALLHAPAFQALESAWRGVLSLLQHIEQDASIEIHLLDANAAEAVADLVAAGGDARRGALHQAVVGRWKGVPGAAGWDAIVGLHRFGPGPADMALLAAWSLIGESAGCPFVADADPVLAADPSDPGLAAWMALRRSPSARSVGLVTPRLLLRQPYGARRDPVTAFTFEELDPGPPPASALLWGAGALGWARLWAQTQAAEPDADGTALAIRTIDDLPAVTYEAADGERELVPVAEVFQGEEALAGLSQAGLMPLASHRHEAMATLVSVRSIAEPAAGLAGM